MNVKIPKNVRRFAYDGCHKIYLIEDGTSPKDLAKAGYRKGDLRPIGQIQETWDGACPLRFVSFWDLTKDAPVRQGEERKVKFVTA